MEPLDEKLEAILAEHGEKGSLVSILVEVQKAYHYLPEEALRRLAQLMELPLAQVYSVANFYKTFSLKPRGRHVVSVCLGTACHVRGGPNVVAELERLMGIKSGETTEDLEFTLESVNCLGACALGPIVVMDGEVYGQMSPGKARDAFEEKYVGTSRQPK